MSYDTRDLLARLIQCEAGGEGFDGMAAQSYHHRRMLEFQRSFGI